MPPFALWFVVAGLLLTSLALAGSYIKRLPLSVSQVYLLVGVGMGPIGLGLLRVDPIESSHFLEVFTEIGVILSLFAAGLKLRTPLSDGRWRLPLRLATVSMATTVALVAAAGVFGLGLPLGGAILLGAILAPTDPVLAADVQITNPDDRDRLRFSLTGEAGLNDGTAFPFVMLGLGLLGLRDLGDGLWRWVALDVVWAIVAGIGIGALLGVLVGRTVVHIRSTRREAFGQDEFLALGLIGLSYGLALLVHAYAFLAVFAAGLALRAEERRRTGHLPAEEVEALARKGEAREVATDVETAPAYMASAVLVFSEQIERLVAIALVVLVGGLLTHAEWSLSTLWFVPLLFFVIRPIGVALGLAGTPMTGVQRGLVSWFGIRGIGSMYYLAYAITHGLPEGVADRLLGLALATIAVSIAAHGLSVTPIMGWYTRRVKRGAEPA